MIVGCTSEYQDIEKVFKQVDSLVSSRIPIAEDDIANPYLIEISSDDLLFTVSRNVENPFSVYDIKTGKKLADFGFYGRGPDELMHISTLQVYKNRLSIFDSATGKIITIASSDCWKGTEPFVYKTTKLVSGANSIVRPFWVYTLSDSLFIGTGISDDNTQFQLYNHIGNYLCNFEPYPLEMPNNKYETAELALAYQGSIAVNPKSSGFVWASVNGVILKFFKKDSNSYIVKTGEYIHEYPQYKFIQTNTGRSAVFLPSTRIGFLSAKSSEKYFYLLYKGVKIDSEEDKNHHFISNIIFVYDQEGVPVRKFVLDRNISTFTVSEDDTQLIAYTSHTKTGIPELIVYDIY